MDQRIKQYADSGDLKSLKYIFVDSLDVDPTFEQYVEDYNYCKSIPGLLEQHIELMPFINDSARWTEEYWVKLKMDLVKNFSDQRMRHMREVAKVYLADKVQRIQKERHAASTYSSTTSEHPEAPVQPISSTPKIRPAFISEEEQKRNIEEAKRQIEVENKRIAEEQKAKDRERKARAAALEKERPLSASQQQTDGVPSKKAVGIAIAVVAVAAIVALVLLLK